MSFMPGEFRQFMNLSPNSALSMSGNNLFHVEEPDTWKSVKANQVKSMEFQTQMATQGNTGFKTLH